MAVTLSTAARNAACNAVTALVDAGGGAGKVRIRAGSTTLVDIALSATAFGAASVGVATAAGMPKSGTAGAAGTADGFQILDNSNALLWSGSAGTSGTDMILDNTSIANGQTVNLTAFTHTQPAT